MNRQEALRILGLTSDSSKSDIRAAYLKLAKQFHPDLNTDPEAVHQFRLIKEAYDSAYVEYKLDYDTAQSPEETRYSYPKYSKKARDPEYRRKAEEYKKRKEAEKNEYENEIKPVLNIFNYFSLGIHILGIIFSLLLLIDFLLPSYKNNEVIISVSKNYSWESQDESIVTRMNAIPKVNTTNHSFSPSTMSMLVLHKGDTIDIKYTPIFGVTRSYFIRNFEFKPAYDIYRNVWLFPVTFFFLSVIGLIYTKDKTSLRVNSIFITALFFIIILLM